MGNKDPLIVWLHFGYLSLTSTMFSPPSSLALNPYQSIYNPLVQTSFFNHINCTRYYFSLCILFFLIETLDCSSCLPSKLITHIFFFIYFHLSFYFTSAFHHQFFYPLNICVIAQIQSPYFHHLLFTRENIGH